MAEKLVVYDSYFGNTKKSLKLLGKRLGMPLLERSTTSANKTKTT